MRSLIADLELREPARFALDRIPTPAATEALVEAAQNAIGSRFRAGVMNALGQRQGKGVLEALVEGTKDPNMIVRLAAAEALAEQADPACDPVIVAILEDKTMPVDERGRARIMKGRIRLVGNLIRENKKVEAKKICQSILAAGPAPAQAKAAQARLDEIG
ncbi:HEAT repeat domain-containing protein [bacterium]|nr:HEAT repeat domain-containing protein [bacterium]